MAAIACSRRSKMGAIAVVLWVLAHVSLSSADLGGHVEVDTTVDASISLNPFPTIPGLTLPGLPTIPGLPSITGALPSLPSISLPQIPTLSNLPGFSLPPTLLPTLPGLHLPPLPQPTITIPQFPGVLPTVTLPPLPSFRVPAFSVPPQAGRTVTLPPGLNPADLTIPGLTNPFSVPSTTSLIPLNPFAPPRGFPRRVFPAGAHAKTKN